MKRSGTTESGRFRRPVKRVSEVSVSHLKSHAKLYIARDQWHKADFDNLKKNPEAIKLKREEWVLNHDAEAHALKVGPEVLASLRQ